MKSKFLEVQKIVFARGPLTAREIAEQAGCSTGTARKHLRTLRLAGEINRETSWYDQHCYTWLYFRKRGK